MASLPLSSTRAFPLPKSLSQISSNSPPEFSYDDDPIDASKDARQIVRMAQCPQCSYLLQEPVTLPCGNSLCKRCIPKLHLRQNISYPATPNRIQGFTCPFATCGADHAIGDCSVDVVLNKIMAIVRLEMRKAMEKAKASEVRLHLQEKDSRALIAKSLANSEKRPQVLLGGKLLATYSMVEMGELAYDSEVMYTTLSLDVETSDIMDNDILLNLKSATRAELDCQVCYGVFLDPFTTTCGHTFCRICLHRVMDHSNLCPICRRVQAIPPGHTATQAPSNMIVSKLLNSLCAEAVAAREESIKNEEKTGNEDMEVALFICTLSFPNVPTFLHIFEPRYRLMIRRAIEHGDRKFGMLRHNPTRESQGELGQVNFFQYGTLLHIINVQYLPDGRSLIETIGVSRFKVVKHGIKDDYTIGKIERIEDISIPAEEAMEARETSRAARNTSRNGQSPSQRNSASQIETMSTQALFELSIGYVKRMREESALWLQKRVFQVYGECPTDPGTFPWWFASVLPISDSQKYKLLATESVRERLKICAGWIVQTESQRNNWNWNYNIF
ncbi:hypothetical protein K3495_g2599 [Podosphaera aphanis]|nr:hypothetical protein K3495_g2599 [Podosphaera aphanis]